MAFGWVSTMVLVSSCLVHPEGGIEQPPPPSPPQFFPSLHRPAEAFFEADSNCEEIGFEVSVGDTDSSTISIRASTTAGVEARDTFCAFEPPAAFAVPPSGVPFPLPIEIQRRDFRDLGSENVYLVSFYVTDRPFLLPREQAGASCGRIAGEDPASTTPHVARYNWTVRLVPGALGCGTAPNQ